MEEISIEDKLIYNNNKLVADKIRKTLLNIRNIPGISEKRWIWELIQNAKDVPNDFGKVDIKIELDRDKLIFSHNGSFFTIDNVLGILQQVSSKDSKNMEDQTGKFGTGFIGTHLLSDIVKIKGIVKYRGIFRKFEINLDRSADSSEELLKEVSKSIIEFKKNMTDEANSQYQRLSVYEQDQNDFDTSFEYNLKDNESLRVAQEGLCDLINTAPVTMATQYKKINSITIINKINNEINKYTSECSSKSKNINLHTISITSKREKKSKKLYFYSYEDVVCRLLYQVDKKENGFDVVERNKSQPILFRDFPLIGSENFHFPFFLDGFKFNPLETRNGLFLNGQLNKEANENRKIIDQAIQSSIKFTRWLLEQNINKRYFLAQSKIPEPPLKYDKYAIKWFLANQKKWRKDLIELKLLRDDDFNNIELKTLKLPQFKEKYNKDFYELIRKLNLSGGNLPNEEDIEIWYDIMEKDPLKEVYDIKENTWGFDYLFTEEDLFKKISSFDSIKNLADALDKNTGDVISWLNELYNFLNLNNCKDCLNKFKMIPNKNGNFKKIDEIYGYKDANKIPKIINPIYKTIFGKELNEIIMNEKISISNLGEILKKKSFNDILNEFSNFLKENNDEEKKEFLVNELISFSIDNSKIKKMFEIRKETDERYRNKQKEEFNNYERRHSIWREVEDFWYDYHSRIIESKENISNLSETLSKANTNKPPLIWINDYISFLRKNSTIIEKKKIFPNQNGKFENIRNLRFENSIPEILKDLYNSLKKSENTNFDIRDSLLSKDITSYREYNKLTQKELISEIESIFNTKDKKVKNSIAEKIITILPLNEDEKFKTIHNALLKLIHLYNHILDKNITPVETTITTELNYGLFVKFIMNKLFKVIEKMDSNQIKSKIEIIPNVIKFAWDYQFNDYLYLLIDPRKYTIFVNQNYQLKEIDKIYIKEDFGRIKYSKIEQKLFELSNSKIIETDYNNLFLESSFDKLLDEYKNNFKSLKLIDICKNRIDYAIYNYFDQNKSKNLFDTEFKEFRNIFFSLNKLLKENPSLKANFPHFMKERGNISLKFLECKDDEMDKFIEDVEKIVIFQSS